MQKPRVLVRGTVMQAPLLDTDEATVIEFYDQYGELMALFGKVFDDNTWAMTTRNDPDWDQSLIRMGYQQGPITSRVDDAPTQNNSRPGTG